MRERPMSRTVNDTYHKRRMTTPMWWWREKNHRPARAITRQKLHRLDEENYPDNKKPQEYFW